MIRYIAKRLQIQTYTCGVKFQSSLPTTNFNKAAEECDKWMKQVKPNTHDYAIWLTLDLRFYKGMADIPLCKYWLAISAALPTYAMPLWTKHRYGVLRSMLRPRGKLRSVQTDMLNIHGTAHKDTTPILGVGLYLLFGVISDTYKQNQERTTS